jgi:kynureninase
VAKLGVANIRKKSLRQTQLLRELVLQRGFTVNTPRGDAERGGTICFDFDGAAAVSQELSKRKFFHDYRPRCGLRVSPHFYTTDEELHRFLSELDRIVKEGPPKLGPAAY